MTTLTPANRAELLRQQQNELDECAVYSQLATLSRSSKNAEILRKISAHERKHAGILAEITGVELAARDWVVRWRVTVARIFGLVFALKLMERGEGEAIVFYERLTERFPQLKTIVADEREHELLLIDMLADKKLAYASSIVLGLSDALVELSGALTGFALALHDGALVGLMGVILGISASFSMAASEYLAASESGDDTDKHPLTAAGFTGGAYLFTTVALVSPFFIFADIWQSLAAMITAAVLIVAGYTYYISVAKDQPFGARFGKMLAVVSAVVAVSFVLGLLVQRFVPVA